jgi:hypothetical protein
MTVPVNFRTFLSNHPFHYQMNNLLQDPLRKQKMDNKWSPCAMQISHALNLSGLPVDEIEIKSPEMGRNVRYYKSGTRSYMIDVFDISAYLTARYGAPIAAKGTQAQMTAAIAGKCGIIRFGDAHIDVWMCNRYHQQDRKDLPDPQQWVVDSRGAWAAPSVPKKGILLWEVNKGERCDCGMFNPKIAGKWKVTIGDWQGVFEFAENGSCSWSDGGAKHAGTWHIVGSEVQWSYKDDPKGWVRIFHAKLPIGSTVSGEATIDGVNHGYYSMTKA